MRLERKRAQKWPLASGGEEGSIGRSMARSQHIKFEDTNDQPTLTRLYAGKLSHDNKLHLQHQTSVPANGANAIKINTNRNERLAVSQSTTVEADSATSTNMELDDQPRTQSMSSSGIEANISRPRAPPRHIRFED